MTVGPTGCVALVTGAGSGIGRACVETFAHRGARVVVSDLDGGAAALVADSLTAAGFDAISCAVDVCDVDALQAMVKTTIGEFGRLDIAVNNAGIAAIKAPVADLSFADWRRVLDVNLDGVFSSMKAEIPAMLATGGSIVNVASVFGIVASARRAAYVAAKHAVVGLTKAAAIDYAHAGIRINAVGPAFIDTPLIRETRSAADFEALAGLHPIGRLGTAQEVAELIAFVASPAASNVTGSYFTVDGGFTAW